MILRFAFLLQMLLFSSISNAQLLDSYFAPRLNIGVFVNEKELDSPAYKNIYNNEKDYYLSSYVNLKNIFEALDAKVSINGDSIKITGKKAGNIKIFYKNRQHIYVEQISRKEKLELDFTKYAMVKINNEHYIEFSFVRYLIGGALKNDKGKIMLYSSDFERFDIPLTLEDCFFALDTILNSRVKEDIKTSKNLIDYHMGLGMWIRNNWIRPSKKRVYKQFLEQNITHPDDVSGIIMEGYHYYLNGENKTIKELRRGNSVDTGSITDELKKLLSK